MDDNIKVAASYLRQAASNMQFRINEIQRDESHEKHEESQEEANIASDIHSGDASLAHYALSSDKEQKEIAQESAKIAAHNHQLRRNRDHLRSDLQQHINKKEKEIQSLQGQIRKLNEIADSLEWWRG